MKTYRVRLWNIQGGCVEYNFGCTTFELQGEGLTFVDKDGMRHFSNLPYDIAEEKHEVSG